MYIKNIEESSILKYFINPTSSENEKPSDINSGNDRASLLDKYMEVTDPNYIKIIDNSYKGRHSGDNEEKEQCKYCNNTNLNIMLNDGMIFCNDCSTIEHIIVDHDRPSYRDPPKEVTYLKRLLLSIIADLKKYFLLVMFINL